MVAIGNRCRRTNGIGVYRISMTQWGRLLACLLLQVGLMLSFTAPGRAETGAHAMPDMAVMASHCCHGVHPGHASRHHPGGACCLQGDCVATWLVPPAVGASVPRRVAAAFAVPPAERVSGVLSAPALPPPRRMA
ncbi:hypothetical protein GDI1507 [Gluconacetobacter diazotrophicus PA1 5]|uniref:CopL family metal-binding regulatory protein n=2 Tax=Gluconacetobacter diazotrophicus TaxID=33996 RepID=A9HG52_GLUDA|nr:hypothetical protein GDI1507 [Gluconacetobacter diazotrophicus PA1 5]